jgi:transposase InsO family protein
MGVLARRNFSASRSVIGKVMKKYNLFLNYILKLAKKKNKSIVNNDAIAGLLKREFSKRPLLNAVVSDLTYVKVAGKRNCICILLDLCSRKIISSAAGKSKAAQIYNALAESM